ncbi:LysR family transcriptional regulator [Ramlibacter sp. G-1-2-2]|uniref:LysR family transcriptional regulator n=1 Tax=Ramlibacter agri TaxID=2728837 RepID=A0A848H4V4_9BURK|nr:LysR family transcriptional regulator [Ramlibacter agri]NML44561.1 LysR family transcriptional regulator [Ramlibacter agri]
MDRIDVMRLFTRIVDLGSFTAAAEDLNLPRATATYSLQQLERRLGVRLLHRTTRHVSPTLEGQAYYERCHRVLNEVEAAESFLGEAAAKPSGRLRVDMSTAIGSAFLFPHLGEFCARYPGIELEIGATDRLVDLLREGVDCVVRAGEPRDAGLVSRRVATMPTVTCASRSYIEAHGMPRTIEQFRNHLAVNFLSTATGKHSPFEFTVKGKAQAVTLKGRISVTSTEAYTACCLQGLGFIQAPRYRLERYLDSGELVEALPKFPPPPMPVAVMYPHHRQLAPRVRVFIDWVAERLQAPGPVPAAATAGTAASRAKAGANAGA